MIKLTKHILLIVILSVAQMTVIPAGSTYLGGFNVILTVLIFVCVAYKFSLGVLYAFILGFILDLYSILPFGAITIAFLATLCVIRFISINLLTNKSFYALIGLNLAATVVYSSIIYLYQIVFYLYETGEFIIARIFSNFSADVFHQAIYNLSLTVILFMIFHFTSRRFNAVFIDTIKN